MTATIGKRFGFENSWPGFDVGKDTQNFLAAQLPNKKIGLPSAAVRIFL
jgi:hypothetical protein